MHEAHIDSNKSFDHFRGHGQSQGRGFRRDGGRFGPSNRNNLDNEKITF